MIEKDDLEKDNIEIIKIMVKCTICESVWGINLEHYDSLKDIPKHKRICNKCLENK